MLLKRGTVISFIVIITLYSVNCASIDSKKEMRNTAEGVELKSNIINMISQNLSPEANSRTKRQTESEKMFRNTKCYPKDENFVLSKNLKCMVYFKKVGRCFQIHAILKAKNDCLLERYESRREDVMIELNISDPNERLLLYGVNKLEDLNNITLNGFDERLSKGGLLGDGIYFTSNFLKADAAAAVFRHLDSAPFSMMLISRVLLGNDYKTNRSAQNRAHALIGHHSVIANDEFVVYRGEQVLPEYLIAYTETDKLDCNITKLSSSCPLEQVLILSFLLNIYHFD